MDWTWLTEAGVASGALAVLAYSIKTMFDYLEKRDAKRRSLRPPEGKSDEKDSSDS